MEWIFEDNLVEACKRDGFSPSQINVKKQIAKVEEPPYFERERKVLLRLQKKLDAKRNGKQASELCG